MAQDIRGLYIPNKIQPGENSMGSGFGGILREWLDSDRNPNVLVLNGNSAKRKLNLNWFDNSWNRDYVFAFARKFFYFSPRVSAGFCLSCDWRLQPPSILPISFKISERDKYFLLSRDFISQAICRKNFNKSSFALAFCKKGSFWSLLARLAR